MGRMHVMDFPEKTQDYLKTIWGISERTGKPATLGVIAEQLEEKTSTASEAIKRLAERSLVDHQPYAGVTLTESGRSIAVAMVRRHRLIEMFLTTTLGYGWDEVHDEADLLEHAVSDRLLTRINDHLGHPSRDPHGDPIPDAAGEIEDIGRVHLGVIAVGESVTVERIHDSDPDLLRYLAEHRVRPGARVVVLEPPVSGMARIRTATDQEITLAETHLPEITVRR